MRAGPFTAAAVVLGIVSWPARPAKAQVNFAWASVGDPGNPVDTSADSVPYRGDVAYRYNISKHEVTNAQYAAFLNAKASSDPFSLYNPSMSSAASGGITRGGVSGGYTYAVKTGFANKPVNFVSWADAARFVNWLNNGQGNGDTEHGSYDVAANSPRQDGATYVLPNVDEWHKAAYYQPAAAGGDADGYWAYPTRSNTMPAAQVPPGAGGNSANFNSVVAAPFVTDVGAYASTISYYGAFDLAGNVAEWLEADPFGSANLRPVVGYAFDSNAIQDSGFLGRADLLSEENDFGFRVAQVPEPAAAGALHCAATAALPTIGRRRPARRTGSSPADRPGGPAGGGPVRSG